MKKLALGVATAAVLLSAASAITPAMAQVGFYAGHRGVGVELGAPGYYDDGCGPYRCGGYYDYYDGGSPGVVIHEGGGWHGHVHGHGYR